ncbi:DUF4268 domain-containing protein [Thalassolituus alkanivorans]|uniref:DUF4268 domain-containing protein n=1 Tax=Thalassolituus alkanivorans TaxID=2881055 RepID=UPI001E64BD86|nr:DUF4268 domain-containing protein [Thalassolituus alkanivorans]MCB2385866.1 DUF4268 domain-containing protein [Thalassolituus alkanivorans]MCB2421716.1 DUF4268 domain-containing protein [Thalassolituus alkanivorans]
MYKIDRSQNRIQPLQPRKFSELNFTERHHLQEWLANAPEALGEELLIIQKEFDGFDDTRERLDLLALDKDGNLVIIENKLDDTGRDVVWQTLKYASYCSSLSKLQIIEIYQRYLNRYEGGGDASSLLCEFFGVEDMEELKLNKGNSQRLMMVAANFRKEVTSTALWLLGYGIQVQCFKTTPFSDGNELYLNIEQIIPTPEAKELMIGISAKEAEEKNTDTEVKQRHKVRTAFWEQALEAFRHSDCALYNNISPGRDHWLSAGSGISGVVYNIIFAQKEARIELWLARTPAEDNKALFDILAEQKAALETAFGQPFNWQRLDGKKSSRISVAQSFDGYNPDSWPAMSQWLVDKMSRFEQVIKQPLIDAWIQVKNNNQ